MLTRFAPQSHAERSTPNVFGAVPWQAPNVQRSIEDGRAFICNDVTLLTIQRLRAALFVTAEPQVHTCRVDEVVSDQSGSNGQG
jgi:hypothetical protein